MLKIIPLLVLAMMISPVARAANKPESERADQRAASLALARHEILPLVRVLEIATARVPGDVIKIKLEKKTFGFQYEVKVLAANGRLREIEIDAKTGKILSVEED